MKRSEAIEKVEASIYAWKPPIKVLLSTTKQVEEVVGKIKGSIILEKSINSYESKAIIATLNEILTLLTEEE